MTDKPKFVPKVIPFKGARLAFERAYDAVARTNKDGSPKMRKNKASGQMEPDLEFSGTILLDPSNKDHAATIVEFKQESVRALNHLFGEGKFTVQMLETQSFPNFHLPWGYGNDLPKAGKKIYSGFENMFFVKLKDKDYNRPHILNRQGKPTIKGDPQALYSGCDVAGTTTLFAYNNESRGVGANLRTLVFLNDNTAFGGNRVDANSEFAALGDLGPAPAERAPTDTPFGSSSAAASSPLADPFAIQ